MSQVSTEEPAADGRADYLLKNQRSRPLAVVETKRFSIDPYSAKERVRQYAVSLVAPFVKDIIRMAAMNAVLHGFDHSPIVRRDSIGGSEDRWDEIQFDCILENPPFSGAGLAPKRSLRVEKGDKYVLFLAAALRSLRPGGRAGIVLPSGILFGDTNAHVEVKKRLLAECDLQAVVTLPKGMFEPYTPNPTCFLIFQKTGKPTKETWFYRVEGDASSLRKARKFGPQFPNDFPDLLAK